MSDLSENLFSCNWRFFWCVFSNLIIEWTMWYVILSSDSEDAAGGVWHVWNRREYEWIPKSIAGGVSWRIGRFSNWLVVQWSSSDLVLVIKEGRCLHDAANEVVVRWSLEQVHESTLHIL